MNSHLTLSDLPDLSDWRFAPIWTIEQAALLWGGIDPAFFDFHKAELRERYEKYRRAVIARQAFLSGIVLGTLPVHELYIFDDDQSRYSNRANQNQDKFTFKDIDIRRTTVMNMALINWAKKQNCQTLKKTLIDRDKERQRQEEIREYHEFAAAINAEEKQSEKSPSAPPLQIEYRPLQPLHDTPEYEVASEVVAEIWNNQNIGVKPPKQSVIQEIIAKKLESKLGAKPTQAQINRVDALARPMLFKNQSPTAK